MVISLGLLPYPGTPSSVKGSSLIFLDLSHIQASEIGRSLYRNTSKHSRLSFQSRAYRLDKLWSKCLFARVCVCVCMCTYVYVWVFVRVCVCVGGGGWVCVCLCVSMFFYRKGFFWLNKTINVMSEIRSVMVCWFFVSRTFEKPTLKAWIIATFLLTNLGSRWSHSTRANIGIKAQHRVGCFN